MDGEIAVKRRRLARGPKQAAYIYSRCGRPQTSKFIDEQIHRQTNPSTNCIFCAKSHFFVAKAITRRLAHLMQKLIASFLFSAGPAARGQPGLFQQASLFFCKRVYFKGEFDA
ncbi:MAG: hypothetical protein LBT62_06850 [Deltaproteobacteria bacterium]|jgi:hypothetical protein|nr:hypothetical protein [Deltaproteobacteria bacterium]